MLQVAIHPREERTMNRFNLAVIEQNDEWLVGHRYLSAHTLEAILTDYKKDNNKEETPELTAA
jgi:hypothetical protein